MPVFIFIDFILWSFFSENSSGRYCPFSHGNSLAFLYVVIMDVNEMKHHGYNSTAFYPGSFVLSAVIRYGIFTLDRYRGFHAPWGDAKC